KPFDVDSQTETLELALSLFENAQNPGQTLASEQRWSDNDDWQLDFMNINKLSDEQIDKLKADFLEQKRIANELKKKH
ncbi:MAG: glycine reductase, partial [Gammaproteobacteria bacterium]|nr:glycine reductase [Gammaproteobacteria bacterium]